MPEPLLYMKAMAAAAIASALFVLAVFAVRRTASTALWNQACVPGIGLGLTVLRAGGQCADCGEQGENADHESLQKSGRLR